jgi:kynureninase
MTDQSTSRESLAAADAADPLAGFRGEFDLPDGILYFDGNSLGALPRKVAARMDRAIRQEWGDDLIRSWNSHGWIDLPARVGDKIARVVGAAPGEMVAADSTSVNLFKLLVAALRLRPGRKTILTEAGNFPTDLYVAQGVCDLLGGGHALRQVPGGEIASAIDGDVAVVMATHVNYQTGDMHDMAEITAAAHDSGALMLWDLSHSAGAVPVDLNLAHVDLAVGCGYKFLNGGPGAPAFLFVASRLQDQISPPLSGWMGHAAPFDFADDYRPAPGITRNLCGTPAVLGLVALEAGLDLFLTADMVELRRKSLALTDRFMALVETRCAGHGIVIATPRADSRRASQVSLRHQHAYPIMQALIARGVIGDFRAPDILRFGMAPLYLRHVDIWDAVEQLRDILETGAWDRAEFHARAAVT